MRYDFINSTHYKKFVNQPITNIMLQEASQRHSFAKTTLPPAGG